MKYTNSHEWIQIKGNEGTVGVTQHAQRELGDIVFVELPQVGKTVKRSEQAAVLESTKAAADVYAPVSGKVLAVNEALREAPEMINLSPETDGWIFKVQLTKPEEVETLLDPASYQKLVAH